PGCLGTVSDDRDGRRSGEPASRVVKTGHGVSVEVAVKRLLFVDEAPSVEAELQQAMPRDWEATCVSGVAAAQARLAESRFDLIVADVRVPGGDGTALLQYAREHYPHMVRVMLSGYVDRDSALRAVPVAHQFVAKPC